MSVSKRDFLKLAGATAAGAAFMAAPSRGASASEPALKPITGDAKPISREERLARVAKAQRLMAEKGIDAILLEPGSAMLYFTGISWWRSERLTAVVIPRVGEIGVVTPFFEEPSVRESMTFGDDVRTWNEHENPFDRVAGILKDRGLKGGKIGLEHTVRYFVVDGLKKVAPNFEIVSADPVTLGCRMFKSAAELDLMRTASDVTLTAYAHVWGKLEAGMTNHDIAALMRDAQGALGGQDIWTLILLGEASAYPHGSHKPQVLKEGDIVLMDCGCAVHGYQSDISRTFVFGAPTKHQCDVWNTVHRGQQVAFETAQLGTEAGKVDDAVRAYYESLGYGPGYKTPGLSHRTGHGIGMDGHESVNFVHGEKTKLQPGMCFSDEPGIYIFGDFGVRLEDCIHLTEAGPHWFTEPPKSLEDPIGKLGPIIGT
ncbi:M24 family metallopeptidase [Kordiimonas marina]|uniref:M24 family metallopeptidase n=1 Tax=Kordiimonas marina TaxID=2872312 RepID=UPI001FF36A33|nr:Xaa-Pro peptidase family protein [Kordiimonas marina]MCJ9430557.1 Xaa-Pro peptidase family protein [Kordiimonas marina]